MTGSVANAIPFVWPAETRQAQYFKAVLKERRAEVDDEIADHAAALTNCQGKQQMRRLQQMIGEKRREQFELDCLLEALGDRFFPTRPTRAKSIRSFDVEITRTGTWWKIQIPEIGGWTKTRRREDAEMIAREHIAVIIGTPIADVAVRVVNGS
jgi:hypothetical protein